MTTKTIRLTTAWLDRNAAPVAVVITLVTFLVAGAIAAIGRYATPATMSSPPLPILIIATPAQPNIAGRAPEANVQGAQPPQPVSVPTAPPIVEQPAAAPPQVEAVPTPEPVATATMTAADAWSEGSVPNDSADFPAIVVVPEPQAEVSVKQHLATPAPMPSSGALGNG